MNIKEYTSNGISGFFIDNGGRFNIYLSFQDAEELYAKLGFAIEERERSLEERMRIITQNGNVGYE